VTSIVVGFNAAVILFLFAARQVYRVLERVMKVMVGVILVCFAFNLVIAQLKAPNLLEVLFGFVPSLPEGIELGLPQEVEGAIQDPMILVASLLGTTFSVAGAFFQGNLVRERNWTVADYEGSVGDAIAGVCVLTGVSMIIMITAGTVIRDQPATDIGTLALSLRPLLGNTAYWVFCVGLVAVAMNPFLINAMIGGAILADGIGAPARMSDRWPRVLTVLVMLLGMGVALWALSTGEKPINLIIFGQALTVLGNPLMAITMLWLANRKDVMGDRRNGPIANIVGGIGLLVVLLMAVRVLWRLVLQLT
jgi:Mn2+/Fe2+ NRAMP family transporter